MFCHQSPMRWPSGSDSTRPSGIAPQLMATNGPSRQAMCWCMAFAINSSPVPLSLVIKTASELHRLDCRLNRSIDRYDQSDIFCDGFQWRWRVAASPWTSSLYTTETASILRSAFPLFLIITWRACRTT